MHKFSPFLLQGRSNFYFCLRYLQSTKVDIQEINLKVPWGNISGRLWNGTDPSKKPVLCLHGWKDNAATWDHLLPLLVPELPNHQFCAIDFPGHGLSSHIPPGMMYDFRMCLLLLKRILNAYGWKTISILGHSFGAQVGFLFSGTHPGMVEKYLAIDAITPWVIPRSDALGLVPEVIQQHLDLEEKLKKVRPTYSYETILKKMLETHLGGMDETSCKTLMSRGIKENPKGSGLYEFNHDPRVQYMPLSFFSHRQISFVAKNFQSEVMHVKADTGVKYMTPYMQLNIEKWLRKNNKRSVRFVEVNGSHHCHLTSPESVYPYLFQVLAKNKK